MTRGDTHVAVGGAGRLMCDGRCVRFPAETAQLFRGRDGVPYLVGPAGYAVAVAIARVGKCANGLLGNGFQQSESDDLLCNARRYHGVRVHRSVAEILESIGRLAQRVRRAVGIAARHFFISDFYFGFRFDATDRLIIELTAIGWLRQRAAGFVASGY